LGVARVQVRFCRLHRVSSSRWCSPPLLSPRGLLRPAFGRIAYGTAVRGWAALPPATSLQGFGSRCREPRSRFDSVVSERASHEVPGFGSPALPSALGLKALAPASAIARDHGVFRIRPAVAILPPPPRQPCWRTKCRDAAISTPTKAPEGGNRVGEEGRVNEELSGSAGPDTSVGPGTRTRNLRIKSLVGRCRSESWTPG